MPTFKNLQKLARHYKISEEELVPLNECIKFIERLIAEKSKLLPSNDVKALSEEAFVMPTLKSKL